MDHIKASETIVVEDKTLTAKRSPQLRVMEKLTARLHTPFKIAFEDIAKNRVRSEGTWDEAQEMYGKICTYITEELHFKTPNVPVIIAEDVPAEGPAWLVSVAGSQINLSVARPDVHITLAYAVDGDIKSLLSLNPIADQVSIAEKGMGVDGPAMKHRIAPTETLENRAVGLFSPVTRSENDTAFLALITKLRAKQCHIRIQGNPVADALDIAAGRLDGYTAFNIQAIDALMIAFIVRESGGQATDIMGHSVSTQSTSIVAGSAKLHHKLMALVS